MSRIVIILVFIISGTLVYNFLVPGFQYPTEIGASNKFDKRFLHLLNKYKAGGAYLIAQNNEIKYEKYVGYKDYFNKELLTEKSLFSLGTLSQQYLGVLYHDLIEKGAINPDHTVDMYLNELDGRMVGEQTIRDMLVMKSRLPRNFKRGRVLKWQMAIEPTWDELRKQISDMTPAVNCPKYIPDGCYSEISYTTLGLILQVLHKKDYEDIFQEKIIDRYDLKETFYNKLDSEEMVRGHYYFNESKMFPIPTWDHEYSVGNSGVRATLRDFLKFQIGITDVVEKLKFPSKYFDLFNFSFGWMRKRFGEDLVFWHRGDDFGFHHLVVRVPNKDFVAIFLTNVDRKDQEDFLKSLLENVVEILPKF